MVNLDRFFFNKSVEKIISTFLRFKKNSLILYKIGKIYFLTKKFRFLILPLYTPPVIGPRIVLLGKNKKIKNYEDFLSF